jgi:hypothetical protein
LDDAQQAAEIVYYGRTSRRKLIAVVVALFWLLMVASAVPGLAGPQERTRFRLARAVLMTIGVAGITAVGYEWRRKSRLFVFDDGFALQRLFTREVEVIAWTDVAKVYCLDKTRTTQCYVAFIPVASSTNHQGKLRILLVDGRQLVITNRFREFSELAYQFRARSAAVQLLPYAKFVMEAGGVLDFDKFRISAEGLTLKRKQIAWPEIQQVSLNRGGVVLFRTKKTWWAPRFRVETIPNTTLLFQLLSLFGVQTALDAQI